MFPFTAVVFSVKSLLKVRVTLVSRAWLREERTGRVRACGRAFAQGRTSPHFVLHSMCPTSRVKEELSSTCLPSWGSPVKETSTTSSSSQKKGGGRGVSHGAWEDGENLTHVSPQLSRGQGGRTESLLTCGSPTLTSLPFTFPQMQGEPECSKLLKGAHLTLSATAGFEVCCRKRK